MNFSVALLFILLNLGLYVVTIHHKWLGINKRVRLLFYVVFGAIVILGMVLGLSLISMTLNLSVIYLLGYIVFSVIIPGLLKSQNKSFPAVLKMIIKKYIVLGFTVLITVVQILLLFELLGD